MIANRDDQLALVDMLSRKGWNAREIALDLQLTETAVAKDLKRLRNTLLRRGRRHIAEQGFAAVEVYRRIQRTLWDAVDELREESDPKSIAPFARALTDTQKAIDAMHERLNRDLHEENDDLALRDLVAQFGADEIEAAAQPYLDPQPEPQRAETDDAPALEAEGAEGADGAGE